MTDLRPILFRAIGLKKAFGGQLVLDGLDLELRKGDVVLLRGENGSGKTTLLNILTGNLEPNAGEIHYSADNTPRSYRFPRRWWQNLNPWDHFRPEFVAMEGIGRTWQDVRLFRSLTLRDNITVAEPGQPGENPLIALINPGRAARRETELDQAADAILARLDLSGRERSSGDMVSLGQSKRVAIARAVAAGARVLFLDEPLAGLDRQGITDVLALLESLVREQDLTLVIVEHVFNFVHFHHLVNVHWMLENGQLSKDKATPIPQVDSIDGIPVTTAADDWFSQVAGTPESTSIDPLPRGATLTRIRRPDRWKLNAKPVLEIKNLIVKRGPRTVIGLDAEHEEAGLSLTISEGEIAILQAPNGWGKSTLFDAICGTISIEGGAILLNGVHLESCTAWQRVLAGLSATPSAAPLFPSLSVREIARLAPQSERHAPAEPLFAKRTISSLSGGEKQRTLLRLTMPGTSAPRFSILDEPFAMLDEKATKEAALALIHPDPLHALLILLPYNFTLHPR